MVVNTVPEKNTDCPKLQLGSTVRLLIAEIPRLLASIILEMKRSKSESKYDNYVLKNVNQ
jgi:hypothetical protein